MIQPLSKKIYDLAKQHEATYITLRFQGGDDQGYLYIDTDSRENIEKEIEDWAWDVYSYSGAGDGNDYGDNITYNLVNNTVTHEEWYMVQTQNSYPAEELELADEF